MTLSYSVMIKPASSGCNLRCRYCFYEAEAQSRQTANYGMMTVETARAVVRTFLADSAPPDAFVFQGGEPTLRGLDFFKTFLELEKPYAASAAPISHTLQTNALCLDESWAAFLAAHQFLVGVSIDGTQADHDRYRKDADGRGTFERAVARTRLLDDYGVAYNILTVVTDELAARPEEVLTLYKQMSWRYLQFTPCMQPPDGSGAPTAPFLSNEAYAAFLTRLFRVWYEDFIRGDYYSIRFFDNLIHILCGGQPEQCSQVGACSRQYMVEANGNVYPCDFYAMDDWLLGNVTRHTQSELDEKRWEKRFVQASRALPEACAQCPWLRLCRNGCRRDRDPSGVNRYCSAYRTFFSNVAHQLQHIADFLLCKR